MHTCRGKAIPNLRGSQGERPLSLERAVDSQMVEVGGGGGGEPTGT